MKPNSSCKYVPMDLCEMVYVLANELLPVLVIKRFLTGLNGVI